MERRPARLIAILKVGAHIALFAVAIVVFTLGTGIGLQVSAIAGSIMWVAAAAIAAGNLGWIFWRARRRFQT